MTEELAEGKKQMSLMLNSRMSDAWIAEAVRSNPIQPILDLQTGQPTGAIRTCPVRLAWVSVFHPKKNQQNPNAREKYVSDILFPPGVDFAVLVNAYYTAVRQFFPQHQIEQDGNIYRPYPLHSPFKAQQTKLQYPGFTPGCTFLTVSTMFKPSVVDPAMNPIVDEARVYPGVWAIAALNTYQYGVNPPQPKKGIGFGLLSLMIVADDENIGKGGQTDPNQVFQGVSINANFNVAAAFGTQAPGGPPQSAMGRSLLPSGGMPTGGQQGFQTQPLPGAAPQVNAADLY